LDLLHWLLNIIHNEQKQVSSYQGHSDENEINFDLEFEHVENSDIFDCVAIG
jgi:hypothetical protein